jgi:hypothetical protein
MAGVSGLGKKTTPVNDAALNSQAADAFIAGARADGAQKKLEKTSSAKVFKRVMFSLDADIDRQIDQLSLIPRDFRATRSDVIRAAIALLAGMPEQRIAQLIKDTSVK